MMSYTIGYGMQTTSSTLIGNQVGKGNLKGATDYFKTAMQLTMVLVLLEGLFFYFLKEYILGSLTSLDALQEELHLIYFWFVINVIPDCIRGSIKGVFRALGK